MKWRRQWNPTPVLLPGKSHGRRSLVCCSPWGRKESDMTERLTWMLYTTLLMTTIHSFNCHWLISSVEKAMAPHSSTLPWKIPRTEEPGRLQSMGFRHDWVTSLTLFTFMHWRRKWQPTPVFLPGESQGRGNLVDYCLWGCTESDMTEAT